MTENLLEQTDDQVEIDPTKNYLTDLVGEGKKFKSPEELARGKFESDSYIKLMEKRMDNLREDYLKLREDYTSRASLEETIDKLIKRQAGSETPTATESQQPTFDPKQIESITERKVLEIENSKRQQENYNQVKIKLQERFGSNSAKAIKEQADKLGLTDNFVNDLARNHPSVFLKTFGLDTPQSQETFQAPPRNQQRSDSFAPSVQNKRTWSYYEDMRKKAPRDYLDPKTQVQMQKDAIEIGDAFYDS